MNAKKHPACKLFVLDTNVLMHDPTSLFRFEEHDVFVPMMTLEELDNNKPCRPGSPSATRRRHGCEQRERCGLPA